MSAGDSNGARGSRVQHASASAAYQQLCRSCRVPTEMVEDRAAGDVICRECGLVHEAHRIDESSEWRNFADSDSNEADRTRASEVVNPLLPSGGMATSIASSSDAPAGAAALQRTQARQHSADSGLEKHFMQMKFICDRLGLANRHKERADELFKQMHDQGQAKRKHAAAQAACVYIACRMENREHTFREICAAAPGTNVKDISRMVQALKSVLKEEQPLSSKSAQKAADPKQHVGNFYTGMGVMDKETVSATKRMVDNFIALRSEDPTLTSYRQPATIAGACIYLALLVKDERAKSSEGRRKLWNSLQESSGMKQPTLAAAFRQDIFPRRVKIVPAELASSEEVQALSGVVN